MKKLIIKEGMKFVCSDEQIKNKPYLKDYSYTVVKKHGKGFLVRWRDSVGCGEDMFYKWELETMKMVYDPSVLPVTSQES